MLALAFWAEPNSAVTPERQVLQKKLKHDVRDLLFQAANTVGPADVRSLVINQLKAQGKNLSAPSDIPSYGSIKNVTVATPPGHPELMAITTTLGITCGEDTSLYLLRKMNAQWTTVLTVETNGYPEISGAQGFFKYAISPSAADGGFFVVTANVTPWCSSMWQTLRYQVHRVSGTSNRLTSLSSDIYIGGPEYTLFADSNTFTLQYQAAQRLDPGILLRTHIQKFRVNEAAVDRIPPLALQPQDFLAEWLSLPWEEAKQWAAPGLQPWHLQLLQRDDVHTEIAMAQPCDKTASRTVIAINVESTDTDEEVYFTIRKDGQKYFIESVSLDQQPFYCPGDTPAERQSAPFLQPPR